MLLIWLRLLLSLNTQNDDAAITRLEQEAKDHMVVLTSIAEHEASIAEHDAAIARLIRMEQDRLAGPPSIVSPDVTVAKRKRKRKMASESAKDEPPKRALSIENDKKAAKETINSYNWDYKRQNLYSYEGVRKALKDKPYASHSLYMVVSAEITTTFNQLLNHVYIITSMLCGAIVEPGDNATDEEKKKHLLRKNDELSDIPRNFGYMIELFLETVGAEDATGEPVGAEDVLRYKIMDRAKPKAMGPVTTRFKNFGFERLWTEFQDALKVAGVFTDYSGDYQKTRTILRYARLYRDLVQYYVQYIKYPPLLFEDDKTTTSGVPGAYFYYQRTSQEATTKKNADELTRYLDEMKTFYDNLIGPKKLRPLLAAQPDLASYLKKLRSDRVEASIQDEDMLTGATESAKHFPWTGETSKTSEDKIDKELKLVLKLAWVSLTAGSLQAFKSLSLDHFPVWVTKAKAFTKVLSLLFLHVDLSRKKWWTLRSTKNALC